jgi:hypothetical protein
VSRGSTLFGARRTPLWFSLAIACRVIACGGSADGPAPSSTAGNAGAVSGGAGSGGAGAGSGGAGSDGAGSGGAEAGHGGQAPPPECSSASDCDVPAAKCSGADVEYFTDPACTDGKCSSTAHVFPCEQSGVCNNGQCGAGTPSFVRCTSSDVCTPPADGCSDGSAYLSYGAPECVDGVCEWTRTVSRCTCSKGLAACMFGNCFATTIAGSTGSDPCSLVFESEGSAAGPQSAAGHGGQ